VKRRIFAALAALALALNALWPLLALAQPKSIPTEICSVGSVKTNASADAGRNLPAQPAHHDQLPGCCAFCVGGMHAAHIAPAPAGFALDPEATSLLFASAYAISWRCPHYLLAVSRGPPAPAS
jgi:hypothetical protein